MNIIKGLLVPQNDEVHAVLYGNLCIISFTFWAMGFWFKLFHLIVNILVEQAKEY